VYEYALVDRTGRHDLGQLRALQDCFLKYELKSVPDVAEVATIGGMVRQYQVVLDPDRLRAFGITHMKVIAAIENANREAGGAVLEMVKPSTWSARAATSSRSTTSARSRFP
jgi:Cu(I)/Ag(I) efflux system membrane protein CusA/SilA